MTERCQKTWLNDLRCRNASKRDGFCTIHHPARRVESQRKTIEIDQLRFSLLKREKEIIRCAKEYAASKVRHSHPKLCEAVRVLAETEAMLIALLKR